MVDLMLEISGAYLSWPDWRECDEIQSTMDVLYDFPHCVAIVDGMHFPLKFWLTNKPEDYYTRKGEYTIHALLFVNH